MNRYTRMDDKMKDHPDPKPHKKEQLQTDNVPTNNVGNINGTN